MRYLAFVCIAVLVATATLIVIDIVGVGDETASQGDEVVAIEVGWAPAAEAGPSSGEWWGHTTAFSVLMRLNGRAGYAAIAIADRDLLLRVEFALPEEPTGLGRFKYVLSDGTHVVGTWFGRPPPPWDRWKPGDPIQDGGSSMTELVIERIDGVPGTLKMPLSMYLTNERTPGADEAQVFDRLRELLAEGTGGR